MKISPLFLLLGLLGSIPWVGRAEITPQDSILGKFFVSSVNGTANCVKEGRIIELKKGDTFLARGTKVSTGPRSSAILVLSNGTAVFADEETDLQIERFEQEPFTPNNNLRMEPSNSVTIAKLTSGRILLSTPRLLSGTSMIYQTPHAAVSVHGDKLLIEADEATSRVALITGTAAVSPRDVAGNFLARGEQIVGGQEALVIFNVPSSAASGRHLPSADSNRPSSGDTVPAAAESRPDGESSLRVLQLSGSAEARLPNTSEVVRLSEGTAIPAGSILSTGEGTLLLVQPFPGAVTVIRPHSVVAIEQRSIANAPSTPHRTSSLMLQAGSMISIVDPAGEQNTDYLVRTLHGTATAHGTLFVASVENGGLLLATVADSVNFTSTSGETFRVDAGQVLLAQPGQKPQPPIPLVQALERNPRTSDAVLQAFASLTSVVSNNVGGLTPAASTQLLSQTAAACASALPEQAEKFASDAAAAIAAPHASFANERTPALAAVLKAIAASIPDRATPMAVATARSARSQVAVIGSATTAGVPARAGQIAGAVARMALDSTLPSALGTADLQTAAAIAAAVSSTAPKQASAASAAVMQAVLDASREATPALDAQRGALIAAAATRAAPDQAVAIARTMMRLLAERLKDPAPALAAQTGSLLAGAIISVVPDQAQPVATAVMLLTLEANPRTMPEWKIEYAGIIASGLAQSVPARASEIYAGIGGAIGRSQAEVEMLAARNKETGAEHGFAVSQILQAASLAFTEGRVSHQALIAGAELARTPGSSSVLRPPGTGIKTNKSTSIIITQFDPARLAELILDLDAALAAQTSVQFYTEPDENGGNTVRPWPTVPRILPAELLVSPAALPR